MPRITALPSNAGLFGDELVPIVVIGSPSETESATAQAIADLAVARCGVATLVGGTAVVSESSVTTDTLVFLTVQETGVSTGAVRVSARVPGVSFSISADDVGSPGDTCAVAWMLVEPPV